MIKAPFNFIPLSDQVVFPEWTDQISHDVPFSDGISGTISVTLTAESPIFVADGHSQNNKRGDKDNPTTFSKIGDKYFLPGTTVKGAIRNVLEILSFSKMDVDRNARFAQRDLSNKDVYPLIKDQDNIHCGWLSENNDRYEIIDCGHPYRIGQRNLDAYLNTNLFEKEFSERNRAKLTDEQKNACYKYKLLEKADLLENLTDINFSLIDPEDKNSRKVGVDPYGDIIGTIVLTGQPGKWIWPRPKKGNGGKYYEFVFPNSEEDGRIYTLDNDIIDQYKFIYAESEDWKYACKEFLPNKGIPVFFRLDEGKNKIKDWGLAFLYRLPYDRSVAESLPKDHTAENQDLSECIFGFVGNNKKSETDTSTDKERNSSLKGRVQFSPFMSNNAVADPRTTELILAGPKASYYPIYIDQESQGDKGKLNPNSSYLTYNAKKKGEKEGHPNGWKRYLLRSQTWGRTATPDTDTVFTPLLPGAIFKGKIRFHNLRPIELGALLTAMTFHGNQNECHHHIGMAKSYGYGKMKLQIITEKNETEFHSVGKPENEILSMEGYMAKFEEYMNGKLKKSWNLTPQVRELLTIAHYDVPSSESENFTYMSLDMENRKNEFIEAKTDRLYLQKYNTLIKPSFDVQSIAESWNMAKKAEEAEEEMKKRTEAAQKAHDEVAEAETARRNKKKEKGLLILDETHNGKYKVDEFKKLRNVLTDYLENTIENTHIPEDQLPYLRATLLRLSQKPSRDEKKKKLWITRDSSIWTFIEKITSKDFADKVYNQINK